MTEPDRPAPEPGSNPVAGPPTATPESTEPESTESAQMTVEAWIRQHQAEVWRYLCMLGAQPADAADLTQETFLRFLQRQQPQEGAPTLLRHVARGLFIDRQRWLRRRRAREQAAWTDEFLETTGTHGDVLEDRWLRALAACRSELPSRARAALDLFYRDQRGRLATAEELDMSPDGLRNLLARTRRALKSCIEKRISAEEAP